MKITYSSTVDDTITYNELIINSRVDVKNNARYIALILLASSLAVIFIVFDVTKEMADQYKWLIRLFTICLFFYVAWPRKKKNKMLREKFFKSFYSDKDGLGAFGKFTIELGESAFRVTGEGCDAFYELSRVTKILVHENYAIIKTGHDAHIIPRAKIEQGSLEELLSALQAMGIPETKLTEAKADRIQPGLYVFIAAAICLVITLLSYVTADTSKINRFGRCLLDKTTDNFSGCFDILSKNEISFALLSTLFITLFVTSLRMFYKNWKNLQQHISCS